MKKNVRHRRKTANTKLGADCGGEGETSGQTCKGGRVGEQHERSEERDSLKEEAENGAQQFKKSPEEGKGDSEEIEGSSSCLFEVKETDTNTEESVDMKGQRKAELTTPEKKSTNQHSKVS